jgi:hypothetical protein
MIEMTAELKQQRVEREEQPMKGHDDRWIRERILRAARKNGLPAGITSIYESSTSLPSSLRDNASRTGIPVLTIVAGENRWTVLGTEKIIANEEGTIKEITLDDIKAVHWPGEETREKRECDCLVVEDNFGIEHRLWVPPGREFFAVFNILLRLKNLKGRNVP